MSKDNIPERKIIWEEGGLVDRVAALETTVLGPSTGQTDEHPGAAPPRIPAKPINLSIVNQQICTDDSGEHSTQVTLCWDGDAQIYEIAIARRM